MDNKSRKSEVVAIHWHDTLLEIPKWIIERHNKENITLDDKYLDELYSYDDNDNWPPRSPVAMWFDDTILDDFLKDWATVQKKLYAGEITQAEYFEWKIMWPDCDDLHI